MPNKPSSCKCGHGRLAHRDNVGECWVKIKRQNGNVEMCKCLRFRRNK